jgi:penicillin G amidase
VIGGTIPGVPAVLVGRSEALGWGLTTAYLDDQDVFIEEAEPGQPEEYRTPDGWASSSAASRSSRSRMKPRSR